MTTCSMTDEEKVVFTENLSLLLRIYNRRMVFPRQAGRMQELNRLLKQVWASLEKPE